MSTKLVVYSNNYTIMINPQKDHLHGGVKGVAKGGQGAVGSGVMQLKWLSFIPNIHWFKKCSYNNNCIIN